MHAHLHGLSMSMQHGEIMLRCSIAAAAVQGCIHRSSRATLRGLRADFLHVLLCCRVAVPVLQSCEAAVLAAAAHCWCSRSSSMMLCPLQTMQNMVSSDNGQYVVTRHRQHGLNCLWMCCWSVQQLHDALHMACIQDMCCSSCRPALAQKVSLQPASRRLPGQTQQPMPPHGVGA